MLQSMGSQRVGHNLATEQQQQKVTGQSSFRNTYFPERETAWPAASSQLAISEACPSRVAPPVSDLEPGTDAS